MPATADSMLVFQSSLPRGERQCNGKDFMDLWRISILAPTRGATNCAWRCSYIFQNFNPRSHEGSDSVDRVLSYIRTKFQSSLPRGERLSHCDDDLCGNKFQSSLPRGERLCTISESNTQSNFNPRSHEGSDLDATAGAVPGKYFNPRSHEGSDKK